MNLRLLCEISVMTALFSLGVALSRAADAPTANDPSYGCCRQDGAEVAGLLKNADRLHQQFKPREAAAELQKVLQFDSRNFEALVRMARAYIDIGDSISEQDSNWKERKLKEYTVAEDYARRALKVDPQSTWGHFWLAASVGSAAVILPIAKQIELSRQIRDSVERSIALDGRNGLAYHIYGVWHRKMAEIGRTSRVLASVFYGSSPPQGSLDKSIEYLKKAVTLNPSIIVSRLELARTHVAKEEWPQARALLKSVADLPIQFSDDAKHKKAAEQLLEEIKER
jgi:tetratricopeptide (TPR) repeat protein